MSAASAEREHDFELRHESDDGWRRATLVYREDGRALSIELERDFAMDGAWRALDEDFCAWSEPAGLALEPEHVDRVLARLAEWSARQGLGIEVAPAVDPLDDLLVRGFALARQPDGSVVATAPAAPSGLLARLFGR